MLPRARRAPRGQPCFPHRPTGAQAMQPLRVLGPRPPAVRTRLLRRLAALLTCPTLPTQWRPPVNCWRRLLRVASRWTSATARAGQCSTCWPKWECWTWTWRDWWLRWELTSRSGASKGACLCASHRKACPLRSACFTDLSSLGEPQFRQKPGLRCRLSRQAAVGSAARPGPGMSRRFPLAGLIVSDRCCSTASGCLSAGRHFLPRRRARCSSPGLPWEGRGLPLL
mmetsp:Transcript_1039/g.3983  ORF Transcript_1039/g.3983 Transcript_1039/m.3983 type:complete len:226 (+) Transcript_1039:2583-3260(+)